MKKILIVIIVILLAPGSSFAASALIYVADYGDTGWQTYTYTAGPGGFTGTAGFVVSNVIDTSAYSELLLDNLSQGGEGNSGFEAGNLSGFDTVGKSFVTVSTSETSSTYNVYNPTEGMFLAVIQGLCIDSVWGVATSQFSNARGQTGTVGSILETAITLAPGEKFSFDWAFLSGDKSPWNDFALFYLKDSQTGAIVFIQLLAQIGQVDPAAPPRVPIAVILRLLDMGP
jgi:hypothetical protein